MKSILAIDIGGPIIRMHAGASLQEYSQASPELNSFQSLAQLSQHFELHLISQCNEALQAVKQDWMARHDFFNQTKVLPENVHFVRQPIDKAILGKKLCATHFVEDRAEILNHALDAIPNLFLYRPKYEEAIQFPELLKQSRIVFSWESLVHFLIGGT